MIKEKNGTAQHENCKIKRNATVREEVNKEYKKGKTQKIRLGEKLSYSNVFQITYAKT